MGTPTPPRPVKLIIAMLAADAELLASAIPHLQRNYGPVDLQSEVLPWNTTDYYREEMGENLLRQYIAFEPLISPEDLVRIKLETNATERTFPPAAPARTRRCLNLDPGYLDANKLVLASTKGQAHRLYLSQGIYAEITLLFHHGAFHPFLYTYADYRWPTTHAFLLQVRKRYLAQLRAQRSP
ncbi:MAG: DUF4416 family protein [Candidatus Binatia bacterium]|nr:DUF4416 family protein [Candidatus Binatia bacterium]